MNKIQNVGVYILSQYSKETGTIELVKLFYLIDVAYYRLFGKTLSGTQYIRAEKGPYSREITNELCKLDNKGIKRELKPSRGFSSFPKVAWSIADGFDITPVLRQDEKELIKQVLNKVKGLDPQELEKLSYKTEPMQDIIAKEKKANCPLINEPLDFAQIEIDEFMKGFQAHLKTPISEEEKKCLEFGAKEWEEVELLLQSN